MSQTASMGRRKGRWVGAVAVALLVGCTSAPVATRAPVTTPAPATPGTDTPAPTTTGSATAAPATPAPADTPQAALTLDFWYQSSGPEGLAIYEAAAHAFTDLQPHVTVAVTSYSFDDMQRVLPVALDGGTGPDVGMISWGAQAADLFAKAGHLVDLTDHGAAVGWDQAYPEDVVAYANRAEPGRTFGIPTEMQTVGVYYNADVFTELGLSVPTTFAEFESILAALQEAGHTPIATGGSDGWPLAHVWEQLIHTNVPFEQLTALEVELDPNASYDSPEMVAAAAKLREWYDAGYFQEGMLGTDFLGANSLFITGQAALNIGGTWALPEFASEPDFEAGFFPLPQMDPSLPWHAGGLTPSNVLVSTKYANHPETALEFMEHMLGEDNMRDFWSKGLLVTYRFADTPPPTTRLQGDAYAAMQQTGPGYYMGVNCAEVNRGIWAALQAMIADDVSPADTMAGIEGIYSSDCPKYRTE